MQEKEEQDKKEQDKSRRSRNSQERSRMDCWTEFEPSLLCITCCLFTVWFKAGGVSGAGVCVDQKRDQEKERVHSRKEIGSRRRPRSGVNSGARERLEQRRDQKQE